jgi:hypothetical protein
VKPQTCLEKIKILKNPFKEIGFKIQVLYGNRDFDLKF